MVSPFRLVLAAAVVFPVSAIAQGADVSPSVTGAMPPKTWVDKDTGHRVWRVSDVPNSGAYYFNVNAYTPDDKQMVYNSPAGIMVLDMATMQSKMLILTPPRPADAPADGGGRAVWRRRRAGHCGGAQDEQRLLYEDGSGDPRECHL